MTVAAVAELLECPHCRGGLVLASDGGSVRCSNRHSFDVARSGYLNLLGGRQPRHADSADMVAARDRFLTAGHYGPIAERVLERARAHGSGPARVVEVGAGTGYYLAEVLDGLTDARGVAVDISVPAARRAARAHPRLGSVVADAWQRLPLVDGGVDVALNVFAPRNPAELARVLVPGGALVTVTPASAHLAELRGALDLLDIQPDKQDQLASTLAPGFDEVSREGVSYSVELSRAALRDLVAMGPNAFHRSPPEISAMIETLPAKLLVTVAVSLSAWVRR